MPTTSQRWRRKAAAAVEITALAAGAGPPANRMATLRMARGESGGRVGVVIARRFRKPGARGLPSGLAAARFAWLPAISRANSSRDSDDLLPYLTLPRTRAPPQRHSRPA